MSSCRICKTRLSYYKQFSINVDRRIYHYYFYGKAETKTVHIFHKFCMPCCPIMLISGKPVVIEFYGSVATDWNHPDLHRNSVAS